MVIALGGRVGEGRQPQRSLGHRLGTLLMRIRVRLRLRVRMRVRVRLRVGVRVRGSGHTLRHGICSGIVREMPTAAGDAEGSRAPARLVRVGARVKG